MVKAAQYKHGHDAADGLDGSDSLLILIVAQHGSLPSPWSEACITAMFESSFR
jgi:hypothetical protein